MLLKVIGSSEVLQQAGALQGLAWEVGENEPLGTDRQLEGLRGLLFPTPQLLQREHLNPGRITLHAAPNGLKSHQLALSGTPAQNGLHPSPPANAVWVDIEYPRQPVAGIAIHPSLSLFQLPHVVYIRVVEKYTQRGQRKHRVLLLTMSSVYLCHPSGHVTRWLKYAEVQEAVIMPSSEGDWVLLRNVQPEHDILVCLIDHHNNIPMHTTADELSKVLHRSGVKIVPWAHGFTPLLAQARLLKHKGYISTGRKLDALRKVPRQRMDSGPPLSLSESSVNNRTLPTGPATLEAEVLSPQHAMQQYSAVPQSFSETLERQNRVLDTLSKDMEAIKAERGSTASQLVAELARLREQNLQLASNVLSSVAPLQEAGMLQQQQQQPQPLLPPSVAGAFSPRAPDPKTGISKALVVCVSHGGELTGNVQAANVVQSFLGHVGLRNLRVLRDDKPQQQQQQVLPTRHNIVEGFIWLANKASPGDALLVAYTGPSRRNGWVGCDGNDVSVADIRSFLLASLPPGVRVNVVLDSLPASPGPDLPYCLACVRGRVAPYHRDEPLKPQTEPLPDIKAEVVVFAGSPLPQGGSRQSQGAVAGKLTKHYISVLMNTNPLTFGGLLEAMWGKAECVPVVSSTFPLAEDVNVTLVPGGVYQQPSLRSPSPTLARRPSAAPSSPRHSPTLRRPSVSPSPAPMLPVPLMAPFVCVSENMPVVDPPVQQCQDQEYWRNLVSQAFLQPNALSPPHVVVSSSHSGKQLRLNKDYVSAFVSQWSSQHPLQIIVRINTPDGRREVARRFNASHDLWEYLRCRIFELVGQRALQRQLYPHSRDAQRTENVVISCEGLPVMDEDLVCNDEDWVYVVSDWEVDCGFSFTKATLPVPLMPPFALEDGPAMPREAQISEYLEKELSHDGQTANSVKFEQDPDFMRNLSYHSRLMPRAREPPYFIVEDSQVSHPIIINQKFLCKYVKAWPRVHPAIVYVHNTEKCTMIAKTRATMEFWRYCLSRGPTLQASMGSGNVLTCRNANGKAMSRLAMHKLTVTCSSTPEVLHIWDAVWGALVAEWDASLPKPEKTWSPSRQRSISPRMGRQHSVPGIPTPLPPATYNL